MAFGNLSANCDAVGVRKTQTSPTYTLSPAKSISIMADTLSQYTIVDLSIGQCNSCKGCQNQKVLAATRVTTHTMLAVDLETVSRRLDDHKIRLSPRNTYKSEVERRVSGQTAQLT